MTLNNKKAESDTIDLSTNGYQLDLYVMGHLGIKAGIRAKALMGLFSTKLAGIGLQIESGAYARLWGYFYYHLENWKVNGVWKKDSGYSGALLIEIGAYLDIKFIAEALNGKYSYEPTIYAKEWPLWAAGQRENVYDFAYDDDLTFDILNVDTYTIPSMVYDMLWMDLKTGEIGEDDEANIKNFDSDKAPSEANKPNEEYFAVELSNPNFTYNPVNNQVTIDKSSGAVEQSCDMKITWKGTPLSGSSEVLSRTIVLNWSNDANAATIAFESNGGSAVQMIRLLAGTSIADKMPQEPTKLGYTFSGWYIDKNLTQPFTANTMPAGNTTLYAKWTPNTVNYTVEHYKQNLNGQYDIEDTENTWSGIVGTETAAINKDYEGFTAQTVKQQTIAADGSTRVAIYYDRNSYDLKFDYDNGNIVTVKMPYESNISDTIKSLNPVREGYVFIGWSSSIPDTMPARDLTFIAQWEPNKNIPYTVKHIRENLDGTYPTSGDLVKIETLTGATGQYTNAETRNYTGFTAQPVEQKKIAADGNIVVEIKYARNIHNLTWDVNGGDELQGQYTSGSTKYGETIIKPEMPTREGYTFVGWYKDEAMTEELEDNATMPDADLTLYAKWKDNSTKYNVWIKGVQVTERNANDVLGDGKVSYNTDTKTLTLNGAVLEYEDSDIKVGSFNTGAIYAIGDLNIQLESGTTNTVTNDRSANSGWTCGIYVEDGNLTITGEGELIVTGGTGYTSHGISVNWGKLTIENGTITAEGREAEGVSGIYSSSQITIKGGNINVIANKATAGSSRGLESQYVSIEGGEVKITAGESISVYSSDGSYGIDANYKISIKGGTVIVSGEDSAMRIAPEGVTGMKITASENKDDSEPVAEYNAEDIANYKYIRITQN